MGLTFLVDTLRLLTNAIENTFDSIDISAFIYVTMEMEDGSFLYEEPSMGISKGIMHFLVQSINPAYLILCPSRYDEICFALHRDILVGGSDAPEVCPPYPYKVNDSPGFLELVPDKRMKRSEMILSDASFHHTLRLTGFLEEFEATVS